MCGCGHENADIFITCRNCGTDRPSDSDEIAEAMTDASSGTNPEVAVPSEAVATHDLIVAKQMSLRKVKKPSFKGKLYESKQL